NTGPAQPPPAATPARGGGSLPPRGTSGGSRSSSSGNNVSSTSSNVAAAAPLSVAHDASDAPLRHDASPLIADEADAPPFEPPPPRIEQTPRAAAAAKSHVEPQPLRTEDDSQRAEDEARREGQEPRVASPAATAQAEAAPRVEPPKPRPTPPSIPSLPKRTTPQRTPPQATTTQQTTPQRTPPQSTPPQTTPPQSTPPQRTTPQGTIPQTPLSQSAPPQTTPLSPPPASSFAPPAASGFAPAVPSSPPLTSPPSPPGLKLVPPSSGESANAAFLRETFAPASFLDASPDGNLGAQSDWFRADDLPAANNVAPPSAGGGFASSLDNASASRTSAAAPGKLPASPASAAVEQLKKLLEDRRKPFLVTALDGARKVLLDGDELYVEYAPEGKHLRDLLSKPDSVRMLRELCCETTGREMGVRIRIREAGESDDDEQLTQEDEARQEKQKLREMAEQHPRVQEVLRTFRAEIIDVRRVEAEEGEASRPV
ncbi:MAG TPA: hypothetical protein VNA19_14715, partial [Pyrinomonadaceae bacterium]|nr:hypothetical protein [Pyrinomonadaceae bacterium]